MWTAGNYKKQQNLLMFRWTAVPHACTSENAYQCHFLKHNIIIEQIDYVIGRIIVGGKRSLFSHGTENFYFKVLKPEIRVKMSHQL